MKPRDRIPNSASLAETYATPRRPSPEPYKTGQSTLPRLLEHATIIHHCPDAENDSQVPVNLQNPLLIAGIVSDRRAAMTRQVRASVLCHQTRRMGSESVVIKVEGLGSTLVQVCQEGSLHTSEVWYSDLGSYKEYLCCLRWVTCSWT